MKKYWELAILKNSLFLSQLFWIFFFGLFFFFFASFLWKQVYFLARSKIWSSQMWQHLLTPTKHFDWECNSVIWEEHQCSASFSYCWVYYRVYGSYLTLNLLTSRYFVCSSRFDTCAHLHHLLSNKKNFSLFSMYFMSLLYILLIQSPSIASSFCNYHGKIIRAITSIDVPYMIVNRESNWEVSTWYLFTLPLFILNSGHWGFKLVLTLLCKLF